MNPCLLDTQWIIDYLRRRDEAWRLLQGVYRRGGRPAISAITVGELHEGVLKSRDQKASQAAIDVVLTAVDVLPLDSECARTFAELRFDLRRKGTPVAELDLLIAATAIRHDLPLASRDKHFDRVAGLKRYS